MRLLDEKGLTSEQALEVCLIFSALVSLVALAIYDRRLLKISWRGSWCFIGAGVIGILFLNLCYYTTIKLTSLSVAAVLLFTAPIFVTLLSCLLFKERITRRKVIALTCAVVGCVLVSGVLTGDEALSFLGVLTGIGAGLGYALYSIFSRYALLRGYHPFTTTVWTFIAGAVAGAFITDWSTLGNTLSETRGI